MSGRDRASVRARGPRPAQVQASVYRNHNCASRHHTYVSAARCIFRANLKSAEGEGRFAVVHYLADTFGRGVRRVVLYPSQPEAAEAGRCGSVTCKRHELVTIGELPELKPARTQGRSRRP